jgi:hypothetical protein
MRTNKSHLRLRYDNPEYRRGVRFESGRNFSTLQHRNFMLFYVHGLEKLEAEVEDRRDRKKGTAFAAPSEKLHRRRMEI